MENIQSITMEVRPRLQICNIFINMKKEAHPNQAQIQLSTDSIVLILGDKKVNLLLGYMQIIPSSLSALSVTNFWISFRVHTKSDSYFGSFDREIVTPYLPKTLLFTDTFSGNQLLKTSNCKILCSCCKNPISKNAFFERVLPLPDADVDPSEWFCCKHNCNNIETNFSPTECDLFYGPFFVTIHHDLIDDDGVQISKNTLTCNRCLQHLGKTHKTSSCKLWNSCIEYQLLDLDKYQYASDPLDDFCKAFNSCATGIFGEEIVLQYLAEKEYHYLFLKPMDWHLSLLIEPNNNSSDTDSVSLQKVSVVKMLYKYVTNENDIATTNVNEKYCDVSLGILEAGLKHLVCSTKRFPQMHRVAGDYYIGHIELELLKRSSVRCFISK